MRILGLHFFGRSPRRVLAGLMVMLLLACGGRVAGAQLFPSPMGGPAAQTAGSDRQPQRASVEAVVNTSALQPGQQAVAAIVVDIKPGYHAQSHTPSDSDYIAFKVTLHTSRDVTAFAPIYPPGEDQNNPQLGHLNVYQGRVIVYVPLQIKSDAPAGPLKLSVVVGYQICNDNTCFPPEQHPFEIDTTVVPRNATVTPNKPELFKGFDFAIFTKLLKETTRPVPAGGSATTQPDETQSTTHSAGAFHFLGLKVGQDSYAMAFLTALLVGLIFNVMPCVLPVLPLKAIGFYETSQHNRAKAFSFGLVFSAGIVATFGLLSVLILFGGLHWGELFSYRWFVWLLVAILVLLALSTFGKFNIRLPMGIYRLNPRHDTYIGNFLFGILTAVLSTPCTAPIFPLLLIWAGTHTRAIGVAILLTVGVGMAIPYLFLSALPELARKMPRTGPISELVKQMMGFILLGVAAYFAGTQLVQAWQNMWLIFGVAVAAGVFLIWRSAQLFGTVPAAVVSTVLALILCGVILIVALDATQAARNQKAIWRPYSSQLLANDRAARQIVLVEFTATWCANCQYVAATVFSDPRAQAAFMQYNVELLRADLTHEDAPGWPKLRELSSTGGIPLTAIYSPRLKQPIQLTSIYTVTDLLAALKQAAGREKSAEKPLTPALAMR